jgi:hypothetical protein
MRCKLPLILALTLLGGAAAPPVDCVQNGLPGQTYPAATDLTGQPNGSAGLAGESFAVVPNPDGSIPCRSPLPVAPQGNTLQSESSDVIHGLPALDILRPITEPQPRPEFR